MFGRRIGIVRTIDCVAVRLMDGEVRQQDRPARHGDLLHILYDAGVDIRGAEQGFLDSDGEFQNREDAWVIAENAGQRIDHTCTSGAPILFSEDLW